MDNFTYVNSFSDPKLAQKIAGQMTRRQTPEEAEAEKSKYTLEFFCENGISGFRVLAPEGHRPAPPDWCLEGVYDPLTAAINILDRLPVEDVEQFCKLFDRTPEFRLRR